jgi:GTPase SAR1 family protein
LSELSTLYRLDCCTLEFLISIQLHPNRRLQYEAGAEGPRLPEMVQSPAQHPRLSRSPLLKNRINNSWDLGGQPRFRTMWERYCRSVSAIVFVVDAFDWDAIPVACEELQSLLSKPSLEGIPLLVLGNKSDLRGKMSVDELIEALELKKVTHREISCYGVSAKEETNLDAVLQWLIARSGK